MTTLTRILLRFIAIATLTTVTRAELKPGAPFPSATLSEIAGAGNPSLGGQILVVDFWASWCAPCKASFPALGKIAGDYASRGVTLIGVSVDESPGAYAAFVKKFAPPFRTLHDTKQALARAVQIPAMPTTYLVDREGNVRAIHSGFHGDSSDRQLRAEIDALLGNGK